MENETSKLHPSALLSLKHCLWKRLLTVTEAGWVRRQEGKEILAFGSAPESSLVLKNSGNGQGKTTFQSV